MTPKELTGSPLRVPCATGPTELVGAMKRQLESNNSEPQNPRGDHPSNLGALRIYQSTQASLPRKTKGCPRSQSRMAKHLGMLRAIRATIGLLFNGLLDGFFEHFLGVKFGVRQAKSPVSRIHSGLEGLDLKRQSRLG